MRYLWGRRRNTLPSLQGEDTDMPNMQGRGTMVYGGSHDLLQPLRRQRNRYWLPKLQERSRQVS